MNMKPTLLILLLTYLLLHSAIGTAGNARQHSHAAIVDAVKQFLASHQEEETAGERNIQVGHLDPRLNLEQCAEPLQTYLAPGAKTVGKTTVGVRCQSPRPWALYVPARVDLYQTVYQTAGNLPRGHIIRDTDIAPIKQNLTRLHRGYFSDKDQLLGKETRRRLQQGQVITPNQVKAPLLVKRGEQVELIARSELFAVRMNGKAMMDGARGDRIRVKNLSSERIIEGTVTQAGQVTVIN
jgi:flagella basal body P-ring formation protein FlgA